MVDSQYINNIATTNPYAILKSLLLIFYLKFGIVLFPDFRNVQ